MKVTFLGSAAAEGIPFPYCQCSTCMHARKHKGKNIRKRCSYMINDDLLIDIGPDLFTACAMHDVDLINTKYILVTHSHIDHFSVQNLKLRSPRFRNKTELPLLTVVAGPSTMMLLNHSGSKDNDMGLERVPMLPFEKVEIGPYKIKSIKAAHAPSIGDAMNFIIDDGKKKTMIASDTGIYTNEVWKHLENEQIDLLIIEATKGNKPSNINHLNIKDIQVTLKKMETIKAIDSSTLIYATHFGHQHCPPHRELSEMFDKIGLKCVYDGLELNI